ncbi:MAG: MBL fold metallo-hydrolase [Bacteroidia bacterium]|nr:MBL fold metallo-hydrolase [Bacteroidia bacterium]
MQQKSFGKLPSGKRLERIRQSPNYRDGSFQNIHETEMMAEDASYIKMTADFLGKGVDREPTTQLPSIKTDLKSLPDSVPSLIWFGHSSYLLKVDGKNILVDPVFSERASPFQFMGSKNYSLISPPYSIADFPDIDMVIISHDHYDHLDYNSILQLKSKTKLFCVGLGVGSHLEYWGVDPKQIIEFDWWQIEKVFTGFELVSTPARHFSGRGFTRNNTLWSSYVLSTPSKKFFIGGDSGYDTSFKTIGEKYGPFDLTMLECGQYNTMWPSIHMMPEETAQAGMDLIGLALLPVHWGKFTLALHPWKEPVERVTKAAEILKLSVTTPLIGEVVELNNPFPNTKWWESIK